LDIVSYFSPKQHNTELYLSLPMFLSPSSEQEIIESYKNIPELASKAWLSENKLA
jgi:hypothetical protein